MDHVLTYNEPVFKDESFLTNHINLTKCLNLHVRITDGKDLFEHSPIEGLIVHVDNLDLDDFMKKLSVSWIQRIRYLRIVRNDKVVYSIINDKIYGEGRHLYFKKVDLDKVREHHFNKIAVLDKAQRYIKTDPPKIIIDLDKQLRLENSTIYSNTIVYLPTHIPVPNLEGFISPKYKIITPLWLTYMILSRPYVIIVKEDVIRYRFKRRNPYMELFPEMVDSKGLTIQEVLSVFIRLFKPYPYLQWIDNLYLTYLEVETITLGRLIECHI